MENNDSENKGLDFVKEQIKPKTKKKIKKILILLGITVAAAVIFGFVARVIFVLSEGPVNKLLGVGTPTPAPTQAAASGQRTEVTLPVSKTPTREPDVSPTPQITKEVVLTPTPEPDRVPSVTEPAKPTEELTTPTEKVTAGAEGSEDATPSAGATSGAEETTPVETTPPTPDLTGTSEPTQGAGDEPGEPTGTESGGQDVTPEATPETTPAATPTLSPLQSYAAMVEEMRALAEDAAASLVRVYSITVGVNWLDENMETRTEHTGVLMADNGVELLILTSCSGVAQADRLEVKFSDNTVLEGILFSSDKDTDLAVVAVNLEDIGTATKDTYTYAVMGNSDALIEGEPVIAVGRPNGYFGAVGFGFVSHSGIREYITDGTVDVFTTDVQCSADGDGMMIGLSGEMLGIIRTPSDGMSCTAASISGITDVMLRLLNAQELPYFGIRAENIPDDIIAKMPVDNGIYVNEVAAGSPAAAAGIVKGDVIYAIDESPIYSVEEFNDLLLSLGNSRIIKISVYRSSRQDGEFVEYSARITSK